MVPRHRISIVAALAGLTAAALVGLAGHHIDHALSSPPDGRVDGVGVDVLNRTPFPERGGTLTLELALATGARVEARGSSIEEVEVRAGDRILETELLSHAASGYVQLEPVLDGHGGWVTVVLPPELATGVTELAVDVYLLGDHGVRQLERFRLRVPVYSVSGRLWAQATVSGQAWGAFLLWAFLVCWVARSYRTAPRGGSPIAQGAGLVVGLGGGTVAGYAAVARPLLLDVGEHDMSVAAPLLVAWVGLPLAWSWLWRHRRPALRPWLPTARVRTR